MRIDLHTHSSVSDGLDSPAALVGKMRDAGIDAFALTDHDTLRGFPEARDEAEKVGIEIIPGAEVSADFQGQDDVHILALFVDEKNDRFNTRLAERQKNRRRRGELMAEKLIQAGYALDLDAIRQDVGDGVWGRPHLARALVRAGHASSNDDAFEVVQPDRGAEGGWRFGALAHELDLVVTAGSDFHGTPEGRKHPGGVVG